MYNIHIYIYIHTYTQVYTRLHVYPTAMDTARGLLAEQGSGRPMRAAGYYTTLY